VFRTRFETTETNRSVSKQTEKKEKTEKLINCTDKKLPEEKKRSQYNTKRILNCRLPVPDPDPPIRIRIHQSGSGSANLDPPIRRFLALPRIRIRRSGGFWPSGSSSGSMNCFTYRRDIFRVQKYCVPQAVEKSWVDCVQQVPKKFCFFHNIRYGRNHTIFYAVSYTICPRFL
jgi:hypothetical protein